MNKNLRVSIVVPVYNEAADLPACLEAIAAQTVLPYEVIVVDNNSTDGSLAVAQQYARRYPFVRVLQERLQGVVYARDRGFNAARGAVIGRIDADTRLADDWVESLQRIFSDPSVSAVSGSARYYDMALSPLLNRVDLGLRHYLAYALGRDVALQGANMAVRRSAWVNVRGGLCRRAGLHEDFDISIHLTRLGYRAVFDESLVASLGYRQAGAGFAAFARYVLISPRTYRQHNLASRLYMYPVVWLALIGYLPLKLLHRGYDVQIERFSWAKLLAVPVEARVNPATYVE